MNISPDEAEEALAAIQKISQKTRRSIVSSKAHVSLIVTGTVWLVGFVCTQYLPGEILPYIWIGLSVVGTIITPVLTVPKGKPLRSPSAVPTAKRMILVWLMLGVYCVAAIAIAWPIDGRQLTMFIVLFVLLGWMAMGLLLSFNSFWPGLGIIALALAGYFYLPDIFYLWMGLLVGGGMIALGIYIGSKW